MKLLCIRDERTPAAKHFVNWITEGEVYTMRHIEGSLHGPKRVLLVEVKNPPVFIQEFAGRVEPGFDLSRFVEVDDSMNLVNKESNVEVKEESLILN
jgi:hypothetical protein